MPADLRSVRAGASRRRLDAEYEALLALAALNAPRLMVRREVVADGQLLQLAVRFELTTCVLRGDEPVVAPSVIVGLVDVVDYPFRAPDLRLLTGEVLFVPGVRMLAPGLGWPCLYRHFDDALTLADLVVQLHRVLHVDPLVRNVETDAPNPEAARWFRERAIPLPLCEPLREHERAPRATEETLPFALEEVRP